jgi:hypothetical protein
MFSCFAGGFGGAMKKHEICVQLSNDRYKT